MATALVLLVRGVLLGPMLGQREPIILFILPVLLAAWRSGLKPGLFATALSAFVCDYFIVEPRFSLAIQDVRDELRIALFVFVGMSVSCVCQAMHDYRRRVSRQADLLDHAADALFAWELGGPIIYWNRGAERLYGYTREQVLGRITHELLATTFPVPRRVIEEALEQDGEWRGELSHTTQCGGVVIVESRMVLVKEPDGHKVVLQANRDVTQRKAEQDRLKASEERLRLAIEATGLGVWHVNFRTGEASWCNECEAMYGVAPDTEFTHGIVLARTHPDDREAVEQAVAASLTPEGSGVLQIEHRICWPDGSVRWVSVRGRTLFTGEAGDRHPEQQSGVLLDITDRKRVELALSQSEQRYRLVAEMVPVILWSGPPDGHNDYVNQHWVAYTGLSAEEAQIERWCQLIHPDDLSETMRRWRHAIETGESFQIEYRVRRADGQYRWMLGRGLPLRDATGRIVRWFGTSTDIDDQKRAEEMLKEAGRRKDEFLATLAHELRNPLAPIRNSLQILRLAGNDRAARERALSMMKRQVAQMVHLVDDLLDVSRISRGKIALRQEPVDLATVIHQAVETIRPLAEAAGLDLAVTLPPAPIALHADATRLVQVFSNLLTNACKFTERGGRITLSAERGDGVALVRVRDTGVGIPREMLSRIFEMFVQADSTLERSQGGLGIGLTLTKRLVEMHGGEVEVKSEGPGKGSEFTVRLPVQEAPLAIAPLEVDGPRREAAALSVLVVDDNEDAAESLAMFLGMLGHDVSAAHDGPSALEAVEERRPDVMLCDIGMPGMSGYEVARRLHDRHGADRPVLMALTGYGSDTDRQRSREAGFDYHLVKPVELDDLEQLLGSLTAARGTAARAVAAR